eukprot:TRINITY_DN3257_c0_g1_i1.p1 TRINITY_DN3257_c0_g1~~TRINITY_DN3257_c0_g1_i1.p1  ORF type:complete len:591 (+),score=286.84 TRINITY_DN3257_c0_g1_i1:90-1862(+)
MARIPQNALPRRSKLTGAAVGWWVVLFAVVLAVVQVRDTYFGPQNEAAQLSSTSSRKLLSSGGADDWNPVHTESGYKGPIGWAGIFVWIPMTIWIFSGVAIAADEYFQPALEAISDALGLSADVRGATFLAAASSAPEFFTSFADTFLVSDEGGEGFGVGTIVGSAVFNVLIIVALSTIPTLGASEALEKNKPEEPERKQSHTDAQWEKIQKAYRDRLTSWENKMKKLEEEGSYLPVDWYPLSRDCIFYSASIILLAVTVATDEPKLIDQKPHVQEGCVDWYESLVYVLLYAAYIIFMVFSADFRDTAEKIKESILRCCPCCGDSRTDDDNKVEAKGEEGPLDVEKMEAELRAKQEIEDEAASEAEDDDDEDDDDDEEGLLDNVLGFDDEWGSPAGAFCNIMGIFTAPFKVLFALTIPNVSRKAMEGSTPVAVLSFAMCILWIGFLSAMMVKVVSWIGATLSLHPVVMGLVVLAAGTSVPDALGSYNEAKHGNADAAVSNALGSNVFDICVGLGVPWFIYSLSFTRCYAVPAEEILIPTLILFGVLFIFIFTLAYFKMRLFGQVGLVYVGIYVLFVVWVLVNGLVLKIKL